MLGEIELFILKLELSLRENKKILDVRYEG